MKAWAQGGTSLLLAGSAADRSGAVVDEKVARGKGGGRQMAEGIATDYGCSFSERAARGTDGLSSHKECWV